MSDLRPVFRMPLPHWLHVASVAVIAGAAASVLIAHKGIDAWRERWLPRAEPFAIAGSATIAHIPPDDITWDVNIDVSGPKRADVERELMAKSAEVTARLEASGVRDSELESLAPTVADLSDPLQGGLSGLVAPTGYRGTRSFKITSGRVREILDINHALLGTATPTIDVTAADCRLADDDDARQRAEQAAIEDLARRVEIAQTQLHATLGRVKTFESDRGVQIDAQSSCAEGLTFRAEVRATYEPR